MNVGAKFLVYVVAYVLGAALPLLGLPFNVVVITLVALLAVAMVVCYMSAWRQGHSGVVIFPLIKGPFGASGLSLRLSNSERIVIGAIAAFILGLGCAVAWLVWRS